MNRAKVVPFMVIGFLYPITITFSLASAQQTKKSFTVADEIGLTLYVDQVSQGSIQFSPDGNYFAVYGERGREDLNSVEDSLHFYRIQDIDNFLRHSDQAEPPAPVWVVTRSCKEAEGGVIRDWRWLADSSAVAFLQREDNGGQRLILADVRGKTTEPLTSRTETVNAFDVRDRQHYVYTVVDTTAAKKLQAELQAPAMIGTGHRLFHLLLPNDPLTKIQLAGPGYLTAVIGSKRFEVQNDGVPIRPAEEQLALSPDGVSVIAVLPVPEVPPSWEILYPPPYASSPLRIHAGHDSAHQYVRIDLQTGSVQSLVDAPLSRDAGDWAWVFSGPSWSTDGQEILLPATFLGSKDDIPSRPCIAVVDLVSDTRACVEMLKGHTETGVGEESFHHVKRVWFAAGNKQRVMVAYTNRDWGPGGTTEYRRAPDGTWQVARHSEREDETRHGNLEVTIKQSFKEPPLLIATNKETSRVIWDPNPQLKNFELGEASVYTWKDRKGLEFKGGLYKPVDFKPGQHYPLVIQTHGFVPSEFTPSGVYPTAFAARALAAAGIMVLQVVTRCPMETPDEGPCAVSAYENAAKQLVSEGLADPAKIGIIGFSRTCFYVMETLTTGSLHLKAASITDGVMQTYLQYMWFGADKHSEAESMIGAKPFGEGLQQWLKRSPGFNLDKINVPLLVVSEGPVSLLLMWEPYAGLRFLHKPVDLIILNTDEHVLTNPAVRLASQGGTVDWFRYWLQDYEDPVAAKAEQYARWRELRKMQGENEHKLVTPRSVSD